MKRKPVEKVPIDPQRIRRIPREGFSWIDRRFVREGFLEDLPSEAILLYLFLVAVGDAEGLSFYSDPTISRLLKLDMQELSQSRARLIERELILYRYPLYQVVALPSTPAPRPRRRSAPRRDGQRHGEPVSTREFFARIAQSAREARGGLR